jgi:hypothetical protein
MNVVGDMREYVKFRFLNSVNMLVLSEESQDGVVETEASCGETEILSSRCVLRIVSGKAITVVI